MQSSSTWQVQKWLPHSDYIDNNVVHLSVSDNPTNPFTYLEATRNSAVLTSECFERIITKCISSSTWFRLYWLGPTNSGCSNNNNIIIIIIASLFNEGTYSIYNVRTAGVLGTVYICLALFPNNVNWSLVYIGWLYNYFGMNSHRL